ncbi:MAG: indolepyruvate oxidoreductase subunit beta family protein [Alphaproteobacteria bacterium]|nr:indolepyruvate oxidoreductase subunit beta family protein [Alphaproteobacteria bacterium]
MTDDARPLNVIIAALGGQGGGILAQWLAEAAESAGFPAQATSTPGVAQRTGATTYYLELFPERSPESEPVFSLFPCSGDVDMVVALEPMEAARVLGLGFVTDRTVVVTARERVYAIGEKILAGDGTADGAAAIDALRRVARRVLDLDLATIAAAAGAPANAVIFGALAGCGVLPLSADDCRAAIRTVAVAIESNLSGFDAGWVAAQNSLAPAPVQSEPAYSSAPPAFAAATSALPGAVQALAGHALAQLVDYQGPRYAALYLSRLNDIIAADRAAGGETRGFALSRAVAQRLAAWMSFEDVIRVAQLKTRPGRIARIRASIGAAPDEPVRIIDHLSPGRAELADLLPGPLARLIAPPDNGPSRPGLSLRLATSAPAGFAALKILSLLKPWRPWSSRYGREQAAIGRWLTAIKAAATRNEYDLACRVAGLATWVRGYGQIRRRGEARLAGILADLPAHMAENASALSARVDAALAEARTAPCTERYPS